MSHEWHYMRSWQHVGSTSCFWRVFTRIYITKSGGIFLIGKLVRFHVIDLWATYAYQWDGERFSQSQALHDCIWCSNIMSNFPSFGLAMNWQLGLLFQTVNIQVAHGWPNIDCWVPMLLTWHGHAVTGYLYSWRIFRQFSEMLRWALTGLL